MIIYLFIFLFTDYILAANYNVYVNNSSPLHTLPDRFVSFTIDNGISLRANWSGLNLTFITPLAKALSPSYLRFGGSDADIAIYDPSDNTTTSYNNTIDFHYYELDQLYSFATNAGWKIIYDLNGVIGHTKNQSSKWNSTNAQQFINYAGSKIYDMDWEMGNEPEYDNEKYNITLNGSEIADDYKVLRNILNANSFYTKSRLIGPSVVATETALGSKETQLLNDFLNNNGSSYISALNFHHYYIFAGTANLSQFIDIAILNRYVNVLNGLKNLTIQKSYTGPITIGETSSAWGGGARDLSDTYVAGFMWLDRLGLSALYGLGMVARQAFWGGNYALLNGKMFPYPDYWLTLLYKKLVGHQVYELTISPTDLNLRLYASSSLNTNGIVLYGQTMTNDTYTIDLPQFSNKQATVYVLKESEPENLQSNASSLNGYSNVLQWVQHQPGPNLAGSGTTLPVTVPGYSQFFVVVGRTTITKCPDGWYTETTTPNKCIKFVANTQPLFGAGLDCSTYGPNATIMSIASAFENAEILKQAGSTCSQYFFGLINKGSGWAWWNGDSNTYRNWKQGSPTTDSTQNCASFDAQSGTWTNVDCDQPQCYICQTYF